jgi:hypothetical protein
MQMRGSKRSMAAAILFMPASKLQESLQDIKKRKTLHKKS